MLNTILNKAVVLCDFFGENVLQTRISSNVTEQMDI